jgi:AbiU2
MSDSPHSDGASSERLAPMPLAPAQRLERLKLIVKHLSDTWPHVLQRQLCMQSLGRREDLHAGLSQTCTAHITNMLQDVLVIDLLRELGALVLDSGSRSASVARAVSALRDPDVVAELRAEYEIVRPLGHIGGDELTPQMRAEIDAQWEQSERREQLAKFEQWQTELARIESDLIGSDVGKRLWQARSKGIAHYDVVRDGDDWQLWTVKGTGLTWGEINAYVDNCTKAIEALSLLVRQTSFSFEESKRVSQEYADEFVDAIVIGLRVQKQKQEEKVAHLIAD